MYRGKRYKKSGKYDKARKILYILTASVDLMLHLIDLIERLIKWLR